jgi:drug/metabolite transporter (DMT)-like permease
MDSTTRPLDAFAVALTVVLCLSWGFNQVAVKLALSDIPPLTQGAIRSVLATFVVAAFTQAKGVRLFTRDGTLWPGLVAGALFGAEFILVYRGLLWTTASRAALFIYLTPFIVVIGARWFLPADRFAPSQWLGLALSFAGLVVAFGSPTPGADPRQMLGDLMMLLAAVGWAGTTLVIKASALARAPYQKTMLYQLVVSAPMLAVAALVFGERMDRMPGPLALSALAYQTFWVVSVTFVIWFWLMMRYSANRLSAFTFLTPIFGVLAGYLVLNEPLTPAFGAAVALVAAGLILVNRSR